MPAFQQPPVVPLFRGTFLRSAAAHRKFSPVKGRCPERSRGTEGSFLQSGLVPSGVEGQRGLVKKQTNRKYMPYDVRLTPRAQENRRAPTRTEGILWHCVLKEKRLGFKFTRQKPIGYFILDFYCSKLLLGLEVDGSSHWGRGEYDKQRTWYLNSLGIKIIRYTNSQVLRNLMGVREDMLAKIKERRKELNIVV